MRRTLAGFPAVIAALLIAAAAVAQAVTPTQFVQARADEIVAIVNRPAEPGSPEAAQRETDLRNAVRGSIDFRVLAERTLGAHWQARTPEQQQQFLSLLQDLIETSYANRLGNDRVDASEYQVRYTGERIRNERATVEGSITVRGDQHDIEIKLQLVSGAWVICDVVTDDVSLEESYAESFDHIIVEEGWDGLVARIRTRLTELQDG